MAILKNCTDEIKIELTLKIIKESPRWLGYSLRIFTQTDSKENELLNLLYEDTLFFENEIQPEIPMLCESLNLLIEEKISKYSFSPLDERDFVLEIMKENNIYKANLFMGEAMLLKSYHFRTHSMIGVQIRIETKDLIEFTKTLAKEYKTISNL